MKYKMSIEMEFETELELPELNVTGNSEVLENLVNALPDPIDDIDDSKCYGRVVITRV